jgi:phenylalanyl-tRNA synthetase beta chain
MLVPLEWLRELCSPDLTTTELAERLEMTGTEVAGIATRGVGGHDRFVVGQVLTAEQHPDADRLKVCTVDVGEPEPAHIVCGAPNVAAGQTVAVARPGAIMPGGVKLKKAKLRGQVSEGMILAEDELEIGTDHAGIMVLDADGLRPGQPLADVLPLGTEVLDLEPTPNRPDQLGIYGNARELHAATGAALAEPPWAQDPGSPGGDLPVTITVQAPDLCPRFTARVFEDVTIAPSPPWLKARLSAAGQRPINNVVDITNYVMLLTGQPLHAFDLDRVAGATLVVRRAADGEQVVTLDDQVRTLTTADCLIADGDGPTSIAGIMGGDRSEVSETTTRVLLEVANWHGPSINATSNRLVLRTEASARYEKGLAPEQTMDAQALASALLVQLAGARLLPGTIDVDNSAAARGADAPIRLRDARVTALLGVSIPRDEQAAHLEALGFGVTGTEDGFDVAVPYWRREDVSREADLIEEIARLHGVNENLPATLPARRGAIGVLTPAQRLRRRAEDVLAGRGLYEIAGWSFAGRDVLDRLRIPADSPLRDVVEISNPMSEAQAILRPTILGSLLDAAAANMARGARDLGLFESAAVYRAHPPAAAGTASSPADEHHALAALVTGRLAPRSWAADSPLADVFAAKALVAAVLDAVRVDWRVAPAAWPFLHPGRSAEVLAGDVRLGFVGEVHPLVAANWDIDQPVAAFALDLGKIAAAAPQDTTYTDVVSYPPVRQDLAVILAADVAAGRAAEVIRAAGGELLTGAEVFDVYTGSQVGEGRRSLAFALTFRAADRTLTDEDVAPVRERIVGALRDELGGELRG